MTYPKLQMLIAGQWTDGTSGVSEDVFCPAGTNKSESGLSEVGVRILGNVSDRRVGEFEFVCECGGKEVGFSRRVQGPVAVCVFEGWNR